MARIRVLQSIAGMDFSWVPGQEVDLPGEEAAKWADGVRAELVRAEPAERAVRTPAERATRKPPEKS